MFHLLRSCKSVTTELCRVSINIHKFRKSSTKTLVNLSTRRVIFALPKHCTVFRLSDRFCCKNKFTMTACPSCIFAGTINNSVLSPKPDTWQVSRHVIPVMESSKINSNRGIPSVRGHISSDNISKIPFGYCVLCELLFFCLIWKVLN